MSIDEEMQQKQAGDGGLHIEEVLNDLGMQVGTLRVIRPVMQ